MLSDESERELRIAALERDAKRWQFWRDHLTSAGGFVVLEIDGKEVEIPHRVDDWDALTDGMIGGSNV